MSVIAYCDQRTAVTRHDKFWIFHNLQHIVIIACYVIVVLNDMKPALCCETDRHAVV
jgi:hypothetical protein